MNGKQSYQWRTERHEVNSNELEELFWNCRSDCKRPLASDSAQQTQIHVQTK
jgi:hypothetical protein